MLQEDHAALALSRGKARLVAAIACAGVCVLLARFGLLSLFFLVPLGFAAVAFGSATAWFAFVLATLAHFVLTLAVSLASGFGFGGVGMSFLHFAAFALGFTWLMAGNPPFVSRAEGRLRQLILSLPEMQGEKLAVSILHVRGPFRFIAASVIAGFMLIGMLQWIAQDGLHVLALVVEPFVSAYIDAMAGGDAVRRSILEQTVTPMSVVEMVVLITLRGGALFSAAFLLFISRQAALVLARMFRKRAAGAGDLVSFFAPPGAIWLLSASLLGIVVGRALSLLVVEVTAWNVLVMCALVFLAQGTGIVLFRIARRKLSTLARFLIAALVVVAVLSPGFNLFALGALVVLGVAENWLPLRVGKKDSPPDGG